MFNLKRLPLLGAASFLVFSGLAQAATTMITDGSITAKINDYGTFASAWDPSSPSALGTPGLSWTGTEFVNIDNPSSWYWLKAGGDYVSQYGAGGVAGTVTGGGGTLAYTMNAGGLGLLETWHITSPNTLSVAVTISNNTTADLTNVMWGAGFDPDQGGSGKNATLNTILGQGSSAAVSALDALYGTNKMITLRNTTTSGAYQIGAYINPYDCCSAVDPSAALTAAQAVGYSQLYDDSISLAYNIGTLGVGKNATLGYDYVFAAVPEPETYVMLLAGLCLVGFSARRRKSNDGMMNMA